MDDAESSRPRGDSEMKRITALLIVILAVAAFSGVAVNDAKALNPEQTSVTGITTPVSGDLVRFWNVSNFKPSLNFYHAGGSDWMTPCGSTASSWGTQGFYCGPNSSIYLDYYQHAGNISNYRDGSVAFWLAHEFRHHMSGTWGINFAQPYRELLAPSCPGQYFRYGVNTSRLLNYNDYATDARSQIWALTSPIRPTAPVSSA